MSTFNQVVQVGANWFVLRHGLAAPRNLEAVVGAGPVVDLTWTPKDRGYATTYSVERSSDAGSNWSVVGTPAAPATTYQDATVTAGTYLYRVSAVAGLVTSSPSATAEADLADESTFVLPTYLLAARAKADADSAQWVAFKADLDADLDSVVGAGEYQWNAVPRAADYALGYHCLKVSDAVTAADYAGKAIGLALSAARDDHTSDAATWQSVGLGDGVETDFTLPGTGPVAGTLVVYDIDADDPPGTGGGLVDPADYTVVGTTLTFDTAPASGREIWVVCLYHTATLRYQQTGNGLGGVDVAMGVDLGYPDRYLCRAVATVFDWCYDASGFSVPLKTELADVLVELFDASHDFVAWAPYTWLQSNYGIGRYLSCILCAAAVQGRHADGTRLQTETEALWEEVRYLFDPPDPETASLYGGFVGEGLQAYGRETYEHLFLGTLALADTGWLPGATGPGAKIGAFGDQAIKYLIHSRYSETAINDAGVLKPGAAFEAGNSPDFPVPTADKLVWAMAATAADTATLKAYATHLVENESGDNRTDAHDLLFRDPTATATDWAPSGGTLGLSYYAEGTGIVLARADWDYDSTWIGFQCGNKTLGGHDEGVAGYLELYRGADHLLPSGQAFGAMYANENEQEGQTGQYANIVVIDDGGADVQEYRWTPTYVYSITDQWTRPGTSIDTYADGDDHLFVSCDYKAIYTEDAGGSNPCTLLEREFFFVRPGTVVVYDRVTTGSASYAKHLRWHRNLTTSPVGSGTLTLSNGSGSTSALDWDASEATVQTALRLLPGTGYSSCTVNKKCDGYWVVTFTGGLTVAAITGTASVGGAVVTVYEMHPEGASGARTVQHVVLGQTVSTPADVTWDVNSSRLFLGVDSEEALTARYELVSAGSFDALEPINRLVVHPTGSAASVRFVTSLLATSTATASWDQEHIVGDEGQLEGARVDAHACLFRIGSSVTLPEDLTATYSGTLTWHVSGLEADTEYGLTGAVEDSATADADGLLVFTSTGPSHAVTIADFVTAFSLTAVPDATVGVTDVVADWEADATSWWLWPWQVRTVRPSLSGHPGLMLVSHDARSGAVLFSGDGAYGFTENTTGYGVVRTDFPAATGGYLMVDADHDGYPDLMPFAEDSYVFPLYDNGTGDIDISTFAPWSFEGEPHVYPNVVNEQAGNGRLSVVILSMEDWPENLDRHRITYNYNGTTWDEVKDTIDPPDGIPAGVIAELEALLDNGTNQAGKRYIDIDYVPFDLTGSGSAADMVITFETSYEGVKRTWLLEDDGAGGYTDRTAAWGLPMAGDGNGASGMALFLRQKEYGRPFYPHPPWKDAHLHDLAGTGRPDLFLSDVPANGGAPGHYRWNVGAGEYQIVAGDLTDALDGDEVYEKRLYCVDLTNSGYLDLVLSSPRLGFCYIYRNNGTGTFTEYSVGRDLRHWDSDGLCIDDLTGDGLPDFILGGDGGTDSGVTSAEDALCLSVWRNSTTNPGDYLGVLIRRTGRQATNYFGVSAVVEVFVAGTSFAAASLIRRWRARSDGLPLIFGVGNRATVDYRVTWPDATTTTATGVATNQVVTVTG